MYGAATPSWQLPYAPTPYGSTLNTSSLSARINLDEEVKLAESAAERDLIDSLAEIYSIIRTLDGLEKAYIKDGVTENEYTEICSKLLKQYKTILMDDNVAREFEDLESFSRRWDIECPRATERLRVGMPLTEIQASSTLVGTTSTATSVGGSTIGGGGSGGGLGGASGGLILTATENFITFLDALRLNWVSKTALHPLLSDVIQSVNRVTGDRDFEHRGKIIQWLITLNQMKTSEELNEEQARDLAFDMEQAYNGFKAIIN